MATEKEDIQRLIIDMEWLGPTAVVELKSAATVTNILA
jgi:hypothetical protein